MKRISLTCVISLLLISAIITGCSKEEDNRENDRVAVTFTGDIGDIQPESRATGNEWETGDVIGVYMVINGTDYYYEETRNRRFTTPSTGSVGIFEPMNGQEIYFPTSTGPAKVDFITYYPWKQHGSSPGHIDGFFYPVNVADQSNPRDIDLLYEHTYRNNIAGYDRTATTVPLVFTHELSKFTLKTVAGHGMLPTDLLRMNVRIRGMNSTARFNLATGTMERYSDVVPIYPYVHTNGEHYDAILLPGENLNAGDDWRVEFTINTETYVWQFDPGFKLESGKEHIFTISVQRTPVVLSATIRDWEPGQGGNGVAE